MNQNTIKSEMTSELKDKFCAQYYGQNVWLRKDNRLFILDGESIDGNDNSNGLLLTSLSDITDEDLEVILPIVSKTSYRVELTNVRMVRPLLKEYLNKGSSIHGSHWWQIMDILRSKGYALPWMGYSVEQMIEAGWIKLKGGK